MQWKIWKHSLARAVSMRALAELADPSCNADPARAYLAGLMSDAGASFLLWHAGEREREASFDRIVVALEACMGSIRSHHQELGAALARSWGMDPVVAIVAATHHSDAPPAPPTPYWSLAILSSEMANEISPGDDVTRTHLMSAQLLDRCGAELRIGVSSLKRIYSKLSRERDAIIQTLA